MIEFYYHTYDDGIEQLCQRIKTNWLVYGIQDNINCENDIMLIHAIYRVITTTQLYRKDDIKSMLWGKIKPLCQIDNSPYSSRGKIKYFKNGYDDLFDFCWKQSFSKTNDAKKAVKISKIAYANRTLWNKLVNSNLCLLSFLILFFFAQTVINDCFLMLKFEDTNEISLTLCVLLSSLVFTIGLLRGNTKDNAYYYFPFIAMVIMAIWSISELFSSDIRADLTIELLKRNFVMGLSYLLWYPIIFINNDRLHDLYD